MYSGGYSRATKYSLPAQKKIKHRSKGKSCGYYMRIIFFFSSLIQSLIIISLVLFLVYGKQADSASIARVQHLEESFNLLSLENVELKVQRTNLTYHLNITQMKLNHSTMEKIRLSNNSLVLLTKLENNIKQCSSDLQKCRSSPNPSGPCNQNPFVYGASDKRCQEQNEHLKNLLQLVKTNFTHTAKSMRSEMEEIAKERDDINLQAIRCRRETSVLQDELNIYSLQCIKDFISSLRGISNVTKAFLNKVDTLFPQHMNFQLTCDKQQENLEQIRSNCTGLSREMVDKYQRYLDNVGNEVTQTLSRSSNLEANNKYLKKEYEWCRQNRTGLISEHKQNLEKLQLKFDKEKEKLLIEKQRMVGEKHLVEKNIEVKDGQIQLLKNQIENLNASCRPSTGGAGTNVRNWNTGSTWNTRGGSSSFISTGNALGKPSLGIGSVGSTALGSIKPLTTGLGSTNLGLNRSSSSSGSTVLSLSKPVSNGVSSSNVGSTSLSSVGIGKRTGSGQSLGIGQGSTGLGKTGSGNTGHNLPSAGNIGHGNTGLGYTGIGGSGGFVSTGRTATGGTGLGSWPRTGSSSSSLGTGGGLGGIGGLGGSGTVNLLHHLQELHQVVNAQSGAEQKKQDQSRTSMYG